MKEEIKQILTKVKEQSALIHNITNYVVMNNTANALLAIGASPVMAHAKEEVEDIASISSALVVNMGTLSEHWVESMILAIKKANSVDIPIIFDPVGVGASLYRTQTAYQIIKSGKIDIIRGNASEISALAKTGTITKGVDSTMNSSNAIEEAKLLSQQLNCTIVMSGEIDYIVTQDQVNTISNGNSLMAKVTGMGCTSTAITGACAAASPKDLHSASIASMAIMGIAGEIAAQKSNGPGSFQMYFLDALYNISTTDIERLLKLG